MRTDRLLRARLRETFIITTTTGETWRGVLYAVDARSLVLRDAELVTEAPAGGASSRTPVDGELIVPRATVAYLQRP